MDVSIPLLEYFRIDTKNFVAMVMIEFTMILIILSPVALLIYYIYSKKKK